MYAGGVAVVARSRNSARERAHRAPPRSRVLFRALPPGAPLKRTEDNPRHRDARPEGGENLPTVPVFPR